MSRFIVVVLLLLLPASYVIGQQCHSPVRYYSPPVQYETVVKEVVQEVVAPIAVPVVIPATVFQYLPALQPIVATPVAPTVTAANVTPTVATQAIQQTAVQQTTAVAAPAVPQTAEIDRLIHERIDVLMRERLHPGDKGPPQLILPDEENTPQTKQPPAQQTPATPQTDINVQVANLLASKTCVQCHLAGSGQPVKGGVTLFAKKNGEQIFFQPTVSKQQLLAAVTPDVTGKAAMPPNGPALSPTELTTVRQWVAQP